MTTRTVRGDLAAGIIGACALAGIPAPSSSEIATGTMLRASVPITWTPDLSTADQATLDSIIKLAVGSTLITKTERDILEPDFVTLRAYSNAASPTNAQTVAAVKSLINFVRAIVND